jgi:hypothetical protein
MLLAEIQYETLVRSLLLAMLLVSPYGIYKVREVRAVRRERAEAEAAAHAPPPPSRPRLEDVIDRISELSSSPDTATATVTIPPDVTVAGGDPPEGLVDTLVRDALRRSGLVTTAEIDTPAGRVLELARRADAQQ